jgi:hypothetical protein
MWSGFDGSIAIDVSTALYGPVVTSTGSGNARWPPPTCDASLALD